MVYITSIQVQLFCYYCHNLSKVPSMNCRQILSLKDQMYFIGLSLEHFSTFSRVDLKKVGITVKETPLFCAKKVSRNREGTKFAANKISSSENPMI